MSSNKRIAAQHHRIAIVLLLGGVSLVFVSYVLQVAFLKPENFKERYRKQQYQACIKNYNQQDCKKRFGI